MDPATIPPVPLLLLAPSVYTEEHCDCCGFLVSGQSERAVQAALYDHAQALHGGGGWPARPQ